jgi:integrase
MPAIRVTAGPVCLPIRHAVSHAPHHGRPGQLRSRQKSLTLDEAEAILSAAEGTRLHGYIIVSLLTGARTEEMRAVLWCDIDLVGQPHAASPTPPFMAVWRSVRVGGDTKTRMSRRTLALPQRCIDALSALWDQRPCEHATMPACSCLAFASRAGTSLDADNVRRDFRKVVTAAGLVGRDWTPPQLRHSFVICTASAPVRDVGSAA